MRPGRIISKIIFIILILLVLFMIFRQEKRFENNPCKDCSVKDCEKICIKKCLPLLYDKIGSNLEDLGNQTFCTCTCNNYLHTLVFKG